jgi:hypothetical protein
MKKRGNRQLRNRVRSAFNAAIAQDGMADLNGETPALSGEARGRLIRLMVLCQCAEDLDKNQQWEERDNVIDEVNEFLLRYRLTPRLETSPNEAGIRPCASGSADTLDERYEAQLAVRIRDQVGPHKSSPLIRYCVECSRCFLARRRHGRSCSGKCRQKRASCTPNFKLERRDYMRTWRKLERERNARAKLLANESIRASLKQVR